MGVDNLALGSQTWFLRSALPVYQVVQMQDSGVHLSGESRKINAGGELCKSIFSGVDGEGWGGGLRFTGG